MAGGINDAPWSACCASVVVASEVTSTVSKLATSDVYGVGPADNSLCLYLTGCDEELRGSCLFSSTCAYCQTGEDEWHDVIVTVFLNGFRTCPTSSAACNGAKVISYTFEVFTILTASHSERESIMRMTVFDLNGSFTGHSFRFFNESARSMCCLLIEAMNNAFTMFVASLFPSYKISVWPLPGVESTCRRIIAGYLVMYGNTRHWTDTAEDVCVVYGELGSFWCGKAAFTVYTNERCVSVVKSCHITQDVRITTYDAEHCNIFEIDCCRFCARTRSEMMLWTRALINVKIKLIHEAPNPTKDELAIFRKAVFERVVQLETPRSSIQPLLPLKPRLPFPPAAEGDLDNTDPCESIGDATSSETNDCMDDVLSEVPWAGFGTVEL